MTRTLGTNANNSLTSVLFLPGYGSGLSASDIATINNSIKDDLNVTHPRLGGGAFTAGGQLFIPNRGVLTVLPGDFVGVDSTGWPILVSKNAIASGPWTHS